MGIVSAPAYDTLRVRFQQRACFVQIHRPEANNSINRQLVAECRDIVDRCEDGPTVVVFEGLPDVFCSGADFSGVRDAARSPREAAFAPEELYDLWLRFTTAPFVVVSHVRGKANAGGIGFVSASDIVVAGDKATFGLSEMLFGLMPACVMPFLTRRVGFQRAHYLTLMTQPVGAAQAQSWGLIDVFQPDSEALLSRHLRRLSALSKKSIERYKRLTHGLTGSLADDKRVAVAANREVFSDRENLEGIVRYVETGVLPWQHP
jgi:polyketide biosynthesis enoyl-CoA hydratase PksH